jgi:hopanoid biosynthesis associated protein HpnK
MDRRIIINADDFGLCEGVNKAVVQAHTNGILTSATIMTNMPAAEEAAEIAKQTPTLGVGVHLNLTEGKPISKEPAVKPLLDGQGQFAVPFSKLPMLSIKSGKARQAIRTELAAQIQWVIERGIKPTHLDSHKHIHSFPVIYSIVCKLAKQFGITAIRWPYEPKELCRMPWPISSDETRKNANIVRIMAKINRIQKSSFFKTDAFFGIAHTGKIDVNFLRIVALYGSVPLAEVMTHPGFVEGLDPNKTRLVQQRKVELDALCNEKVKQYFTDAGIKLVHYGQL